MAVGRATSFVVSFVEAVNIVNIVAVNTVLVIHLSQPGGLLASHAVDRIYDGSDGHSTDWLSFRAQTNRSEPYEGKRPGARRRQITSKCQTFLVFKTPLFDKKMDPYSCSIDAPSKILSNALVNVSTGHLELEI